MGYGSTGLERVQWVYLYLRATVYLPAWPGGDGDVGALAFLGFSAFSGQRHGVFWELQSTNL